LYLTTATAQNVVLGALIALPERVLYPFYTTVPRLWGLSPLDDQALGGGIMWVSAQIYLLPILLVVARLLNEEERVEAWAGRRPTPPARQDRTYERP
jgi:putative membrane protein